MALKIRNSRRVGSRAILLVVVTLLASLAYVSLAVFTAGIPLGFLLILYQLNRRSLWDSAVMCERFGLLFLKYERHAWWWEVRAPVFEPMSGLKARPQRRYD